MNVICLEDPESRTDRRPVLDRFVRDALAPFPSITLYSLRKADEVPQVLDIETRVVFNHVDGAFFPNTIKKKFPSCLYVAYSSDMLTILAAPAESQAGEYRATLQEAGFDRLIGRSAQIQEIIRECFG